MSRSRVGRRRAARPAGSLAATAFCSMSQALMAHAEIEPGRIPDELQGVYVDGDNCYAPDARHWIIGKQADFLLLATPDDGQREFVVALYEQIPTLDDGRYVFQYGSDFDIVSRRPDGGLDLRYVREAPGGLSLEQIVTNPDGSDLSEDVTHFTRCDSYAGEIMLPYVELISFIRSETLSVCAENKVEACIPAVFDYLDAHRDKELRPAEIARGLRIASMLSFGIDQANGEADASQIGIMIAAVMPTFPLVGLAVVGQFDYDGSGGVSLDELGTDIVKLPGSLSARIGLDALDAGGAGDALNAISILAHMLTTR